MRRVSLLIAPIALMAVVGVAAVGGRRAASTGPEPGVALKAFSSSAGDRPSPIKRLGTSGYRSDPYQR